MEVKLGLLDEGKAITTDRRQDRQGVTEAATDLFELQTTPIGIDQ